MIKYKITLISRIVNGAWTLASSSVFRSSRCSSYENLFDLKLTNRTQKKVGNGKLKQQDSPWLPRVFSISTLSDNFSLLVNEWKETENSAQLNGWKPPHSIGNWKESITLRTPFSFFTLCFPSDRTPVSVHLLKPPSNRHRTRSLESESSQTEERKWYSRCRNMILTPFGCWLIIFLRKANDRGALVAQTKAFGISYSISSSKNEKTFVLFFRLRQERIKPWVTWRRRNWKVHSRGKNPGPG